MRSLLVGGLHWLIQLPTRFHLWCAERELRMEVAPTPETQAARERMLDLLHAYRERGEFPENIHEPTKSVPCFIDSAGRQCAVAFLLDQSGAKALAAKVASEANFGRIAEMDFPELDAWAAEAGLTKSDLARIQPGYPPTPEQASHAMQLLGSLALVGVLAIVPTYWNLYRLLAWLKPAFNTSLAGMMFGVILVALGYKLDPDTFGPTQLAQSMNQARFLAYVIGAFAIFCGVMPHWIQLDKSRSDPEALQDDPDKTT